MKKRLMLLVLSAILLSAAPAIAQESGEGGGPTLGSAMVTVEPGANGVRVLEELEVANTGEARRIEHILPRSQSRDIEDLSAMANGRELRVERESGELLDRIYVTMPGDAGGEFAYEVSFAASGEQDAARIPLVVPAVPSADDANNVTLEFAVPEGRYLYESFPVAETNGSGTARTSMTSFPSFASYEMGDSPGGFFTASNLYTALALVVIVGCVVSMLLYDRRSGKSEVANA